jgi:hypothetical protein
MSPVKSRLAFISKEPLKGGTRKRSIPKVLPSSQKIVAKSHWHRA